MLRFLHLPVRRAVPEPNKDNISHKLLVNNDLPLTPVLRTDIHLSITHSSLMPDEDSHGSHDRPPSPYPPRATAASPLPSQVTVSTHLSPRRNARDLLSPRPPNAKSPSSSSIASTSSIQGIVSPVRPTSATSRRSRKGKERAEVSELGVVGVGEMSPSRPGEAEDGLRDLVGLRHSREASSRGSHRGK